MIKGNLTSYFCLRIVSALFCFASLLIFSAQANSEDIIVFSADAQTLDLTDKLHPMATARTKLTLDVVGSDSTAKDHIDLVASQQGSNTTWYIVTLKNDSQITRNTVLSLQDSNVTAVFASGGRGKIKGSKGDAVSLKLEPSATITLALESVSVPKNVLLQDNVLSDGTNSQFSTMSLFAILSILVSAGFAMVFYFYKPTSQESKTRLGIEVVDVRFGQRPGLQAMVRVMMKTVRFAKPSPNLEAPSSSDLYNSDKDGDAYLTNTDSNEKNDTYRSIRKDLRAAFELGQFFACFQPIFRLSDRRIEGIEASIQWLHPEYGVLAWPYIAAVAANEPILEELDKFLMEVAVNQVGAWNKQNPTQRPLNLIINAGGLYADEKSYCKSLSYLALRSGLLRDMITIQLQCASLGYYRENVRQFVSHIKSLGFSFSGGNFGCDGPDLFVLRNFAFDCVSLDASLLEKRTNGRHSIGFLKATIDYLRNLSNKIVVTGILDEMSLRAAHQLGCKHGQGFPFAFSLTSENLFEFLDGNLKRQVAPTTPNSMTPIISVLNLDRPGFKLGQTSIRLPTISTSPNPTMAQLSFETSTTLISTEK